MGRDLDIVIFGATGDTGVVGCCFLFFQGKKLGITSWAPAARNLSKLEQDVLERFKGVEAGADGLAPAAAIIADASDYEALLKMCSRTKCVVACAGPFARYGEGLVRACVETGTHYVDVTGEVPWVDKMRCKYGTAAEEKGATIVSCAGYDSIPPDLATNLAAKALEKEGEQLQRFEAYCGGGGGALPTGTMETVLDGVDTAKMQFLSKVTFGLFGGKANAGKKDIRDSPPRDSFDKSKGLVPPSEQQTLKRNLFWTMWPAYSVLSGHFCVPHFMAPINVHTVHHTAAAEGYGGLVYRERMAGLPTGPLSLFGLIPTLLSVGGSMILMGCVALPGFSSLARKARDKFNTPLQQRVRELLFKGCQSTGETFVHGFGVAKSGRKVKVELKSNFDPGLGYTMLSACTVAAQLVQHSGTSHAAKAGLNSAVVALGGERLADALRASGVTIDVSVAATSKL